MLIHIYIHTYAHTYIHTYIQTYAHTYIHMHIHTYIRMHIHTYAHTYIHTCTYIHTHIQTYICTYIHTYIHTHIHTYIHVHTYAHTYIHVHIYIHTYILGLGKRFESSNLRSFATHLKLNFSLRSFAAPPTLMFAHAHSCNLNVWSIMWACSIKVVGCFCLVSLSSDASDMNKTSTRYKAIILFWRLSIGKTNIDKNTCKPSFVFADEASKAVFPPSSQP